MKIHKDPFSYSLVLLPIFSHLLSHIIYYFFLRHHQNIYKSNPLNIHVLRWTTLIFALSIGPSSPCKGSKKGDARRTSKSEDNKRMLGRRDVEGDDSTTKLRLCLHTKICLKDTDTYMPRRHDSTYYMSILCLKQSYDRGESKEHTELRLPKFWSPFVIFLSLPLQGTNPKIDGTGVSVCLSLASPLINAK